jgi:hypothetical protein
VCRLLFLFLIYFLGKGGGSSRIMNRTSAGTVHADSKVSPYKSYVLRTKYRQNPTKEGGRESLSYSVQCSMVSTVELTSYYLPPCAHVRYTGQILLDPQDMCAGGGIVLRTGALGAGEQLPVPTLAVGKNERMKTSSPYCIRLRMDFHGQSAS